MSLADPQPPQPPASPEPPAQDDNVSLGEEVNDVFMTMLPWGVALLFHAGLILIAAFVSWSTITTPDEDEIIIPVMRFNENLTEPLENESEDRIDDSRAERDVARQDRAEARPSNLDAIVDTDSALVGLEGAVDTSPFATTTTSADQFQTEMFGVEGNARRLVFCIDASGSLIDTFPYITNELVQSIRQLSEQQQFTVIFFQADSTVEAPPPGMKRATADHKDTVIAWINPAGVRNVIPGGRANASDAIRAAMRYRPDLIYLLSDNITGAGQFESSQTTLLREIEQANIANTAINTIQFVYPDPLTHHGMTATMELIADRSGGIYRFISAEELNLR
ncbi:MAG: vWA domain-containing protein [Phycisphaeraceae bacterium]